MGKRCWERLLGRGSGWRGSCGVLIIRHLSIHIWFFGCRMTIRNCRSTAISSNSTATRNRYRHGSCRASWMSCSVSVNVSCTVIRLWWVSWRDRLNLWHCGEIQRSNHHKTMVSYEIPLVSYRGSWRV
jgi:hypothetical protein